MAGRSSAGVLDESDLFRVLGISSPALVHGLAFAIGFSIITAAHLVLGEQAPKIFAIRRPEEMAIWCALPMRVFYVSSYPLLRLLDAATSTILRWLGVGSASEHESPHTEEELRLLLGHARAHGELSRTEHRLVEAAFEFDDMVCRQIMVPRTEVVFLEVDAPLADSLRIIRSTLHTRYPLCRGSLDDVVGVVHVKDLAGISDDAEFDLRSVMRPPEYVPETMLISRLLGHFQATRQHLALVVEEFGAVSGIVTLENVLEQIVGAVQDEFDAETPEVVPEGPGRFLVRGGAAIDAVARALDLPLDSSSVDTMNGLIVTELGRVAVPGDRVELDGAEAEVLTVKRNRVARLRIVKKDAPGAEPRSAAG